MAFPGAAFGWDIPYGFSAGTQSWEWVPDPDLPCEDEEEMMKEVEIEIGDMLFSEQEMSSWTSRDAILWICGASDAFEVLGLRPKLFSNTAVLRKRFRRLSLLTHPDKNPDEETAAPAFRRLADAMKILSDTEKQQALLQLLFPSSHREVEVLAQTLGVESKGLYATAEQIKQKAVAAAAEAAKKDLERAVKAAVREVEETHKADQSFSEKCKRRALDHLRPGSMKTVIKDDVEEVWGALPKKQRQAAKGSQPVWGLPQEFKPPPVSAVSSAVPSSASAGPKPMATSGASADPNTLWQLVGGIGLTNNGWERLESRSHPGSFYFLHQSTGRTVLASAAAGSNVGNLPSGWERRESKRKPGVFYYVNVITGVSQSKPPVMYRTSSRQGEEKETPPSRDEGFGVLAPGKSRVCGVSVASTPVE